MVSRGEEDPIDTGFGSLASFLTAGDVLVVNASGTINAAFSATLPDRTPVMLHYSGELPGGLSLVEVRAVAGGTTAPLVLDEAVEVSLAGGGVARLLTPFARSRRLWVATLVLGSDVLTYAALHGRPIRYRHVKREWPLETYGTIFSRYPGSAEMPSASRPFSHEMVTDVVSRGVAVCTLVLHTGVSSLEGSEDPYPERYRVPPETAATVNAAARRGGRVVAVGTTVVRALGAVSDDRGLVHAGQGWTELVVTKEAPVRSVHGLLTGWHEPESSHLLILESLASGTVLARAYAHAISEGYLWHEFGDSHLILPERASK
jgi:S-adenosylmethionine:tRNA ribosyltransferase-isomerase